MIRHLIIVAGLFALLALGPVAAETSSAATPCQPTAEDEMGPFYRPGAPLRSIVGKGYLLTGTVRSARDCSPLMASLIEFWMTGPDGRYDDQHRAAVITGETGYYRLETDVPGNYATRPPHIHIRVSAEGYQTLTTQHYMSQGSAEGSFDLVLIPREE
jgi:protocatechuate 3,4-dioxygenase beta subunit